MKSQRQRFLVVEDDPAFNSQIARTLKSKAKVDQVTTLSGAFQHVAEYDAGYDVIILDRSLPDGDGLELVPAVHQNFPDTKVCVLSGLTAESEQVSGLKSGADLYLCKPLSAQTVREHIMATLRPSAALGQALLTWKDVMLQTSLHLVKRQGTQIHLTKRESQFLSSFFSSERGEATHSQLIGHFWPRQHRVSPSAIHVTIQRLRNKLRQLGITIVAHYGAGYQLQEVSRP